MKHFHHIRIETPPFDPSTGWIKLHPDFDMDGLGFLPELINASDPRKVEDQVNANYQHGGGWSPLAGWVYNPVDNSITYPGDVSEVPLASLQVNDEQVFVYNYAWVCVVQKDGSYAVARMD